MSVAAGPKVETKGLVLALDASNLRSHDGDNATTTWKDISRRIGKGRKNATVNSKQSFAKDDNRRKKRSFKLNGQGNDMTIPNVIEIGTGDFTMEFLCKTGDTENVQYLVSNKDNFEGPFTKLGFDNTGKLRFYTESSDGTESVFITDSVYANDEFITVTFTRSGAVGKIYVDGILVKSGTTRSDNIGNSTDSWTIGSGSSSSTNSFNGQISKVRVYDRELSSKQIAQNFNGFKGVTFADVPPPSAEGQQEFTTSGTFSWTAPAGVTSVCVVCVGGGGGGMFYNNSNSSYTYAMSGGGGGALAWINDYPVTPGQSYTVVVGAGGTDGQYSSGSTPGGQSYFVSTSTIVARGGSAGRYNKNISGGTFTVSSAYGTSGGGNGGGTQKTSSRNYGPAGGGGAGGYNGNGGLGRDDGASSGGAAAGGGGSGGGASSNATYVDHISGGGGGVGIYGQGTSGGFNTDGSGQGGSGGANAPAIGTDDTDLNGGAFGGGGGGKSSSYWGAHAGNGGGGAVRIIWGDGRAFPSTNTEDI